MCLEGWVLCLFSCQQASRAWGRDQMPRELMPGWVSSHSLKAQLGTTWGCQPMVLLKAPESIPALLAPALSTPRVLATSRAEWRTSPLPQCCSGDRVGWKGRGTAGPTANLIYGSSHLGSFVPGAASALGLCHPPGIPSKPCVVRMGSSPLFKWGK